MVCVLVTQKSTGRMIFTFVITSGGHFICAVIIFEAEKQYWMSFKELILVNEIDPCVFKPATVQCFLWKLL